MKNSLKIASPFGIKISIHWTFLFLIAWVIAIDLGQGFNFQQIMMSVLFILVLFICVILHELGHSLAAKSFGGDVKSITLLPIGGMANIKKMPDKPREELLITVAGLAVNVIIAFILWMILGSLGLLNIENIEYKAITAKNFFVMLMVVNLLIVAFNLIPAFPMDGGRILRAMLSFKMSKVQATRIAQTVGKIFAVSFVVLGLFYNPFLIVIGIFVFLGAQAEYQMIKYHDLLDKFKVEDIINEDYAALDPEDTLEKAANILIHGSDNGFVIKSGNKYQGILTKEDLIKGLATLGNSGSVKEVMTKSIYSVSPDKRLNKVYQEMMKNRYPLIPVLSHDNIVGVIELENIHELIMVKQAEKKYD
jgi:Zn-dependent protease